MKIAEPGPDTVSCTGAVMFKSSGSGPDDARGCCIAVGNLVRFCAVNLSGALPYLNSGEGPLWISR